MVGWGSWLICPNDDWISDGRAGIPELRGGICRRTVELLHRWTVAPSHRCTVAPLHRRTVEPLHRGAVAPLRRRTVAPSYVLVLVY